MRWGLVLRPVSTAVRSRAAAGLPIATWAGSVLLHAGAMERAVTLAMMVKGSAIGALTYISLLSWRRLWKIGRDAFESAAYDFGVRTFGALMTAVGVMLPVGLSVVDAPPREFSDFCYVAKMLLELPVFIMPLALWTGFAGGMIIGFSAGHGPDPRLAGSLPPDA